MPPTSRMPINPAAAAITKNILSGSPFGDVDVVVVVVGNGDEEEVPENGGTFVVAVDVDVDEEEVSENGGANVQM